jgi:hypothetical protein
MNKLLLSAILLVAGFKALADQTNAVFPMPKQFDGIRLGMSMKELVKTRTNLLSGLLGKPGNVDLAITNQVIWEYFRGSDPVWRELGMTKDPDFFAMGMFYFQEGKLECFAFICDCERTNIVKLRTNVLASCIRSWGTDFKKCALVSKKGSAQSASPALVWSKDNQTIVFELEAQVGRIKNTILFGFFLKYNDSQTLDNLKDESLAREQFEQLIKAGVIPKP